MSQNITNTKQYDLEERTYNFARDVRMFSRKMKIDSLNRDDVVQLVRSSGSIGANYREANDSLGKKDFVMRAKISRKEAKESLYWLRLLVVNEELEKERQRLYGECEELMKIFGAIIQKST